MKKFLALLLSLSVLFSGIGSAAFADAPPSVLSSAVEKLASQQEFRGLWVATVANLDYPRKGTVDSSILRAEADQILNDAASMGFTAIILQVRPSADSLYPSAINPWSRYLTGAQGAAPSDGFDPLRYWIDGAHGRGLELHAWFNPYRVTRGGESLDTLIPTHPARLNPSWVVRHTDGNCYYNPGLPEVRRHITDVVMEVARNYDVDGIHFDDYFYPGKDFADADTFRIHGAGFATIEEWRVNNVDLLIKGIRDEIKQYRPNLQFGISPFGIWANVKSDPLGSNTTGHESYISQFADTRKWVKYEWIDYIAPQIYWHIGFSVADYETLAKWWAEVVGDTKVRLYIGLAGYKTGNPDEASPWHGVREIHRQLDLNKTIPGIDGVILFRYRNLVDNKPLGELLAAYFAGALPMKFGTRSLAINRPSKDVSTTAENYFVGGASDPSKPLYLNGLPVEDRSPTGLFGLFLPLRFGENRFVFEQNGVAVTRIVTRKRPEAASPMQEIGFISSSVYPQRNQSLKPGQQITLRVRAPIGASVTAVLAGQTYTLQPAETGSENSAPLATTYSLSVASPNPGGAARVVDHGKIRYRMIYRGKSYEAASPGIVRTIMSGAPYLAVVLRDDTDTYEDNSGEKGSHFFLQKGMTDRIVAEDGNLLELASGLWIRRDRVESKEEYAGYNTIRRVDHSEDRDNLYFRFTMNYPAVAYADYDGERIELTVHAANSLNLVIPPTGQLLGFESVPAGDRSLIRLRFGEIGGYYVRSAENGFELVVRKKKVSSSYSSPLDGITIMIDPGHGGKDDGAISLYGKDPSEKHVVLQHSLRLRKKLESLGATVLMTRMDDDYMSLRDRLEYSRKMLPDLFLSLHADSMFETANLSRIKGFSVFYKDPLAKKFALELRDRVVNHLGRSDRGAKAINFYVVRGTWTPSLLLEAGFVTHPEEFEALLDPVQSERYLDEIVMQVVAYFKEKPM